MHDVDRRTFLRGIAALSAAGAGTVLAPGLLSGQDSSRPSPPPVWKKAPCRLCGVGCGLLVAIENGRAVAVQGDPESPVSAGLACAKGYYSIQALYGRDRVTRALMRRGETLAPLPMAGALDAVATRMRETIARYGKDSVAIYGSAQWTIPDAYVASKLVKGGAGHEQREDERPAVFGRIRGRAAQHFRRRRRPRLLQGLDHANVFFLWDFTFGKPTGPFFKKAEAPPPENPCSS